MVGLNQKQMNLLIVAVLVSMLGFLIWTNLSVVEEQKKGEFSVTAKWQIFAKDLLDEGTAIGSGTLAIYDPAHPGQALETGLTLTSGSYTTGEPYTSGETIYIKYSDTTYFDYGMLLEIPFWDTQLTVSTVPTLPHDEYIYVIKMADDAGTTDFDGLKNGASVWDDSATALSSFNRTVDGNYPKLGIMVTNEDVETAYVDPRGYFDYSQSEEPDVLWDLKSYLIIELQPTATTTSGINVNDYMKFQNQPSSLIIKKDAGTSMFLFYPLTTLDSGIVYDVIGSTTNPDGERDGNAIVFEIPFDFAGGISTAIGADDIDIEFSLSSGCSISWFDKYETLAFTTDDPIGEMLAAATNDWSIGW